MGMSIRGCGGIGLNIDDYLDMTDYDVKDQIEMDERVVHKESGVRDCNVRNFLIIPGTTFSEVLENETTFLEALNEYIPTSSGFTREDLMSVSEGYLF